jgi:hypothetical protein
MLLRCLASAPKPPAFYATHVKAICLAFEFTADDLRRVLSCCASATNIACWYSRRDSYDIPSDAELASLTAPLRPRWLSVDLTFFLGLGQAKPDFRLPFFSNITHLDAVDTMDRWITWSGFEFMPCLTHLSLQLEEYNERGALEFSDTVLLRCHALQILLLFLGGNDLPPHKDPRLVLWECPQDFIGDWEGRFSGEPDIWTIAEEVAERQRRIQKLW